MISMIDDFFETQVFSKKDLRKVQQHKFSHSRVCCVTLEDFQTNSEIFKKIHWKTLKQFSKIVEFWNALSMENPRGFCVESSMAGHWSLSTIFHGNSAGFTAGSQAPQGPHGGHFGMCL